MPSLNNQAWLVVPFLDILRLQKKKKISIYCSPLVRCVQTAFSIATECGVEKICIEFALVESVCENWYRSWCIKGLSNSEWGGPKSLKRGFSFEENLLKPESIQPASSLYLTDKQISEFMKQQLEKNGITSTVDIDFGYDKKVTADDMAKFCWGNFETDEMTEERMGSFAESVQQNDTAAILITHGGGSRLCYRYLTKVPHAPWCGYTGITMLDKTGRNWEASLVSDTSHLGDVDEILLGKNVAGLANDTPAPAPATTENKKSNVTKLQIGYWAIRGLGAPLRMICEYMKIEWDSILYDPIKVGDKWDWDCWFKKGKSTLQTKNAFANLPHIIDNGLVICQTNACLKYLGQKFKLYGENDIDAIKVDQCLYQIMDLRNDMVKVFYGHDKTSDFETCKDDLINKKAPAHLQKMENWLIYNETMYCASNSISIADFHLWELIDQLEIFVKFCKKNSLLEGRTKLQQLYVNIKGLDTLANYFKSSFYKLPVNAVIARWKGVSTEK